MVVMHEQDLEVTEVWRLCDRQSDNRMIRKYNHASGIA